MRKGHFLWLLTLISCLVFHGVYAQKIKISGIPVTLEIREAGNNCIRISTLPDKESRELLSSPILSDKKYPEPSIKIHSVKDSLFKEVGNLRVKIKADPLDLTISNPEGLVIQHLIFDKKGELKFQTGSPLLGMGEGGPLPAQDKDWQEDDVEFDRQGRFHKMRPRWQTGMYGSRNPVPLLIGTDGWGLFIHSPWGQFDLTQKNSGVFIPDEPRAADGIPQSKENQHLDLGKGKPPVSAMKPGFIDLFVFDTKDPVVFMNDLYAISGKPVMPPRWALGYMQSHRTLESDSQMISVVDTFREKQIPLDAVIYLGTGFTPRGWNTEQPSFDFNPEIFKSPPEDVLVDLHDRNVKVVMHMVPWDRERLATLHGNIPVLDGEPSDSSHILNYWNEHKDLIAAGVDAWWPDEGDWFNLFERMKRHQMYYQGSLYSQPNIRPWSLHRNGFLGVSKWGGWIWSGDTHSAWKSLEAQIAVGINHSLSLSPFWGSDIGGFFPTRELTGELYIRWFQFGAFTPSFRSHGRTWWTRLPWGWGLDDMGPKESDTPPYDSALNNSGIEPIAKKYAKLRYRLLSYNYSLARESCLSGLPMMRSMWLHYPEDHHASRLGDQYLWGRDILVAPVFKKDAKDRKVYLPAGDWYDWWSNIKIPGGWTVTRNVNLQTMPIYVRAGAIIPIDPVRQYTYEVTDKQLEIRIYPGADGYFTLYEDDGISLEYQEGKYRLTNFGWDDLTRQLTIIPVTEGSYGKAEKIFSVKLIPEGIVKEVKLSGKEVIVQF